MGTRVTSRKARWLSAGAAIACVSAPAHAQDGAGGTPGAVPIPAAQVATSQMDEIVVTARKRAESLQDVPVAVSVIDADALREKNVQTFYDVATEAPGLSIRSANAQRGSPDFFIRGQGSTFGSAPGVVTYFAEAPTYNSILGSNLQFYDLASVQVLKGPQGTLFGRSSTGGAVLVTPARPDGEFSGFVEAKVGNYGMHEFTAAVNVPLIEDVLSFRAAGNYLRRNGFTRSLTTGERLDDRNRESYRLGLLFTPAPAFENYTLFYGEHVDESATGLPLLSFYPNNPNSDAIFDTGPMGFGRLSVTGLCAAITPDPANIPGCIDTRVGRIDALREALIAEQNRIRGGDDDEVRRVSTAYDNFFKGTTQTLLNTTTINPGRFRSSATLRSRTSFPPGEFSRAEPCARSPARLSRTACRSTDRT